MRNQPRYLLYYCNAVTELREWLCNDILLVKSLKSVGFCVSQRRRGCHDKDGRARWRLRTLQALGDAVNDAYVLIVYENKIRAENAIKFDTWIVGQKEKINRSLDRLETEAGRDTLRTLGVGEVAPEADVAVAAALGFSDIMQHGWRTGRPKLAEWFSGWETRGSFMRARPAVDWKTGKATVDEFAARVVAGKRCLWKSIPERSPTISVRAHRRSLSASVHFNRCWIRLSQPGFRPSNW